MNGQQADGVITGAVVCLAYAALLAVGFRYATARTPAGIVRRLARTKRPVALTVNVSSAGLWDPSRPVGHGGFHTAGIATYELIDPVTVKVRFEPRSGAPIERTGTIPPALRPETADMRRRRRLARIVIAAYVLFGVGAFALTTHLATGSTSIRTRTGAVAAIVAVSVAWLATHLLLTSRHKQQEPTANGGAAREQTASSWRHLAAWTVGAVIVAVVFAVAWHLGNTDAADQMSWPTAFLSAGVFVLAGLAIVTASIHHHTYIHHRDASR